MEYLGLFFDGLKSLFVPEILLFLLIGVLIGQVVGILPGIGPVTGLSLLIPLTFGMDPAPALVMLTGVYYGSMFGGALTSIMFNTPGDAASVVTTFDGYPLAKQGKAGLAIGTATIASALGGLFSAILMVISAPFIARFALMFGPAEYTTLIALALLLVVGLGSKSKIKSAIAALLGLALSLVGQDPITGVPRYTFGSFELLTGLDFVVVALGLFAVAEIILSLETYYRDQIPQGIGKISKIFPTREQFRKILPPIRDGSIIGFIIGLLPGAGATIATFISYSFSKRRSKTPEEFGKGSLEGVASAESANNGAVSGAMVPIMTLGIPGSSSTAILLGGMMILGLQPGPMFFRNNAELAWTVMASMFLGIAVLFLINMFMVHAFVRIMKIPYSILALIILILSFLGAYGINRSMFDVFLMGLFGVVGYFMKKNDFPVAPMVLTLVLGGLFEQNLRRALTISDGSYAVFFTSPVSISMFCLTAAAFALLYLVRLLNRKKG